MSMKSDHRWVSRNKKSKQSNRTMKRERGKIMESDGEYQAKKKMMKK